MTQQPYAAELQSLIEQADELKQRMNDDQNVPLVVVAHIRNAVSQLRLALHPERSDLV